MSSGKKRSGGGLLLDLILTICTGGLWLIWILIRYLRNNSWRRILMSSGKKRSGGGLLLDLILTICTGGLWLIWILIRYLRNNS